MARGVTLEAVVEATKITRRHLEALERSDLAALPAPPFTKGFIQVYAKFLGLDAGPILGAYRELEQQRGLGVEERERRMLDELSHLAAQRSTGRTSVVTRSRAVSIAVALGALLVLGGTGWLWARRPASSRPSRSATVAPGSDRLRSTGGSAQPRAMTTPAQRPVAPPKAAPRPKSAAGAPAPAAQPAADRTNASTRAAAATDVAPKPAAVPGLEVPEHGVGTAVVGRRLQGRSTRFAEGTTVAFWTLVTGARPGQVVRHSWFQDGRQVMNVDLTLAGSHFRTHSRLALPRPCSGTWAVEARSSDGRLLARDEFACEPTPR